MAIGQRGEDRAARALAAAGYRIVERNVRLRAGELDAVAYDGETLCFVEVRSRKDELHGTPEETVVRAKQRRLVLAARAWLARYPTVDPCRFDVVAIVGSEV
ncbi:MAG TPA: YraN family protein, partial [Kofleriaceae bacterium]|nr:YraN family protein [Kofleriaceae bacterium]